MDNFTFNGKQVNKIKKIQVLYHYLLEFSLWGPFHAVMFNTIILLLTMSHFKAVLSDPGTVPLPQTRLDFSDIHSSETGMML